MPIDIETNYLEHVKDIITSIINDQNLKIYVFGSRATGKARKYSDLDIALDLKIEIDSKKMSKIATELENTTIPYKIDVVDLNAITENFKKCIENDLVEI